jgi:hypothetical protein
MSAPDNHDDGFPVTNEHIARWEREACEHDAHATSLLAEAGRQRGEAARKRALATMGRDLQALSRAPVEELPTQLMAPNGSTSATWSGRPPLVMRTSGRGRPHEGSWGEAVSRWIYAAPRGLSAADLRERIAADETFSARIAVSDKGYYHALARLKASETITLHKGRYYSPQALADHLAAVERGEAADEPVSVERPSPMGEAILDLVAANRDGVTGPQIVSALVTDEQFASLRKYNTGAYNVIARLESRQQIVRKEGVCRPGPKMPLRDPQSRWSIALASDATVCVSSDEGATHDQQEEAV